jgi:hypothetical protein
MKSSVIFAVSIFDENKIHVLDEFFNEFKRNFSDCDFYIGINYNSLPQVESIIESYRLNTFVSRVVKSELYTGSDASAYQAALKLLKYNNKSYDIYWFGHTKGAVNHRPFERSLYLKELFGNRLEIESLFLNNPKLGSYALRGVSRSAGRLDWATYNKDHEIHLCENVITNELPFTHVNWSYIETMYVINKESVETFLNVTTDNFYNNRISEPCYFETVFPWVATRCGYFPYIKQSECFFKERNLKDITREWIENNKLYHLNNYLDL